MIFEPPRRSRQRGSQHQPAGEREDRGHHLLRLRAAEERLIELHASGVPVVIADKPLSSGHLPSVLIDNKAGTRMALDHLVALGHRDILFINGAAINRNGQLRAEAFLEFLAQPAGCRWPRIKSSTATTPSNTAPARGWSPADHPPAAG